MNSTVDFTSAVCTISAGNPCNVCYLLSEMDAKITEPKDALRHSAGDRYTLLSKVNERHDPMSYRLPVEVVAKIFLHVLPDMPPYDQLHVWSEDLKCDRNIGKLLAQNQVLLASICLNWRDIAHSTPGLYSSIFLNLNENKSVFQMATILSGVERNLERSRGLPLFIGLEVGDRCEIPLSPMLRIMESLCKQAHRWEMLCVNAPKEIVSSISTYTSELAGGAPRLSSLILTVNDDVQESVRVSIGSHTAPLPAPSYIQTWGIKMTPETLDFTQSKDIKIGGLSASELVRVVALSPRLTSLMSCINCDDSRQATNDATQVGRRREVLAFTGVNPHLKSWQLQLDFFGLFPRFTFPALENLDCNVFPGPFAPDVRNFLARSRCPLTTMRLVIVCEEAEYIEILRLIPTLRELDIVSNNITSNFFHYLGETAIQSLDKPIFLPNLRSFKFQADHVCTPFNWSLFRIMLPAASTKDLRYRPLSMVTVVMHGSLIARLTPAVQSDLAGLIDDGLEIVGHRQYTNSRVNVLEALEPLQQALSRLRRTRS